MAQIVCARLRVTLDCSECAYPIPINGVVPTVTCHSCQAVERLEGEIGWDKITCYAKRESIRKATGGTLSSPRPIPVLDNFLSKPHRIYRRFQDILLEMDDKPVACPGCREEQDVTELLQLLQNGQREAHCTQCGAAISLRSAAELKPYLLCSFADPVALVGESLSDDVLDPDATKPVLLSCLGCGAPLSISRETPRILDCQYCNATSYMPDALWLRLHPAQRKRPFYLIVSQHTAAAL